MKKIFYGIHRDLESGITPTGNIIRDAWVFGIIPESESCEGWTLQGIDALYDQVSAAWEPFGHMVSGYRKNCNKSTGESMTRRC